MPFKRLIKLLLLPLPGNVLLFKEVPKHGFIGVGNGDLPDHEVLAQLIGGDGFLGVLVHLAHCNVVFFDSQVRNGRSQEGGLEGYGWWL